MEKEQLHKTLIQGALLGVQVKERKEKEKVLVWLKDKKLSKNILNIRSMKDERSVVYLGI